MLDSVNGVVHHGRLKIGSTSSGRTHILVRKKEIQVTLCTPLTELQDRPTAGKPQKKSHRICSGSITFLTVFPDTRALCFTVLRFTVSFFLSKIASSLPQPSWTFPDDPWDRGPPRLGEIRGDSTYAQPYLLNSRTPFKDDDFRPPTLDLTALRNTSSLKTAGKLYAHRL